MLVLLRAGWPASELVMLLLRPFRPMPLSRLSPGPQITWITVPPNTYAHTTSQ
ncbi:hypothetical protein K523DRAFT_325377 [Schizophyllum commune Tattone D]|nr:hypothetical protein K523DRAFT_325377 [Schizophyllum commune Tattone D]